MILVRTEHLVLLQPERRGGSDAVGIADKGLPTVERNG